MSAAGWPPARGSGLTRTTLQIGSGLQASAIADVVRSLQRVPGVLTVDADPEHAQAFVAHDAGVPLTALLAATNRAEVVAHAERMPVADRATAEINGAPHHVQRHLGMAVIGLAAMCAVIFIDFALPDRSDKRWPFIVPVILLWAVLLLQATRTRRS